MNIGTAAEKAGLSAKTIRYYESVGLVASPPRQGNGYRDYSSADVERLIFLRQARQFGFSIEECRALLSLWQNPARKSAEVHGLVAHKVTEIERHIRELREMKKVLKSLLASCPDNENPECGIIDQLAGKAS
ncbi:MAG: Cu(I)-responsive transcriptional regulator [bacterium]